ncbi:MAG: aspartyl/asparaginyl beta-hydroxylase domain-containing protein, partial [Bacteroidota bacterium]
IKPHRDFRLGYEDDNFRIHIPITTNDQVSFVLGGEQLRMLPGECWYTNVNFTHSVANNGSTDRVHLVIDGERNAWSDELFFSLAPRAQFNLPEDRQAYKQHILETIKGLKEIGTPKAEEMIRELEKRLALSE